MTIKSGVYTGTYFVQSGQITFTAAAQYYGANGLDGRYQGGSYLSPFGGGGAVVGANGAPLTLTNEGAIRGGNGGEPIYGHSGHGSYGGVGIVFLDGGVLNNSGTVGGGVGGDSSTVGGQGASAVELQSTGQINNTGQLLGGNGGTGDDAGGTGGDGIYFLPATSAAGVTNSGVIQGGIGGFSFFAAAKGGDGIFSYGKATIDNTGAGIIQGGSAGGGEYSYEPAAAAGAGIYLKNGGTITDSGSIIGGRTAFSGYGLDSHGGIGVDLANGGTLNVQQGGTIAGGSVYGGMAGTGVFLNGGSVTTAGTIESGTLETTAFYGTPGYSVAFGATNATIFVEHYAQFSGAIGNFHFGDAIDLTKVTPSYIAAHYVLGSETVDAGLDGTLQFAGDPQLQFSSDGHGGTWVKCACFRRGTRIRTADGECVVESLRIGDRVMTRSGDAKPIRWIGQRHYSGVALSERPEVRPVLIRAGALGDARPYRDLWVSPEHALFVDGAIIPASLLTNGVSILTDDSVGSVSYFHLEFEAQEIVFAEGAPAESFVDDDSRQMFDNAAEYALLYPQASAGSEARFCVPRIEEGAELEVIRTRLARLGGLIPGIRATDAAHSTHR